MSFDPFRDAYTQLIKEAEMEKAIENDEVKMRLSPALVVEMTSTLNEFTKIAAQIVEKKYANRDELSEFNRCLDKIKDLINVGENSVSKND